MRTSSMMLSVALVLGIGRLPVFAVTLDDCLRAANEANPTLKAAAQRVVAASAAIDQARSGYYPTIGLSGSYTLTDNPPQAFFMNLNQRVASLQEDFNHPDDTDNVRGSIFARMLLLDAGQRGLMADIAGAGETAATEMARAARQELSYEVTRAYHSVLQASAMITVAEGSLSSIEESLRVAKARLEAGSVLKTDVLNLEVRQAGARESLIRARNGQQLAVAALNTAIGDHLVKSAMDLQAESGGDLPPPPEEIDSAVIESRPELAAMLAESDAASLNSKRIQRDSWPKLSAFGSVDVDSGDASSFEDSYLIGAMVEMDVFTGFRRQSEFATANAKVLEARAHVDQLRNNLSLDLTRSHLMAQEAWERKLVTEASQSSAEESLRITKVRYEQGAADITELLAAQIGWTESNSRAVAARYDYLIACANLKRAQGQQQGSP